MRPDHLQDHPYLGWGEFELKNVEHYSFSVHRTPGEHGRVGSTGHEIGNIRITRQKSLEQDGVAGLESETIALAAATQKNAYCKGQITLARPDDLNNIVQTIRWDEGHVCDLICQVDGNRIAETIEICVTKLSIDDSEFKRVWTA